MVEINLRDYYSDFYNTDIMIEITDELAYQFYRWELDEAAYRLRTYRHKACYSLDRGDGIENEALLISRSPHEMYERRVSMEQLSQPVGAGCGYTGSTKAQTSGGTE